MNTKVRIMNIVIQTRKRYSQINRYPNNPNKKSYLNISCNINQLRNNNNDIICMCESKYNEELEYCLVNGLGENIVSSHT